MWSILSFWRRRCFRCPKKWHGLEDIEMRYRQRYRGFDRQSGISKVFIVRSRIIASLRRQLEERVSSKWRLP